MIFDDPCVQLKESDESVGKVLNVLSRLPDFLAHCLQVQRQKANMKTGFSWQWPLLAQFLQEELWSSHPLFITGNKEILDRDVAYAHSLAG